MPEFDFGINCPNRDAAALLAGHHPFTLECWRSKDDGNTGRIFIERGARARAQRRTVDHDGAAQLHVLHGYDVRGRQDRRRVSRRRHAVGRGRRQSAACRLCGRARVRRVAQRAQFGADGAFLFRRGRQQAVRFPARLRRTRLVCVGHRDGGDRARQAARLARVGDDAADGAVRVRLLDYRDRRLSRDGRALARVGAADVRAARRVDVDRHARRRRLAGPREDRADAADELRRRGHDGVRHVRERRDAGDELDAAREERPRGRGGARAGAGATTRAPSSASRIRRRASSMPFPPARASTTT